MIITEYSPPSDELIELSTQLQSLPQPLYKLGEIVIVPDNNGDPIFAVISLICALRDSSPNEFVYGLVCKSSPKGLTYKPESLLISRNNSSNPLIP
jgi:hypothetical protein